MTSCCFHFAFVRSLQWRTIIISGFVFLELIVILFYSFHLRPKLTSEPYWNMLSRFEPITHVGVPLTSRHWTVLADTGGAHEQRANLPGKHTLPHLPAPTQVILPQRDGSCGHRGLQGIPMVHYYPRSAGQWVRGGGVFCLSSGLKKPEQFE